MRISDWSSDVCSADLGALGHCAECHTPRGQLGQLDADRPLQGGALGRIKAPDISPAGLAARGWTRSDERRVGTEGVGRVDLGGCRRLKKQQRYENRNTCLTLHHTSINTSHESV